MRVIPESNLNIDYEDQNTTSIEIRKMNNSLNKRTPLHSYLRKLRQEIINLELSFQHTERDRDSMLSNIIM